MKYINLNEINPDAFSRFQVMCKEIKAYFGNNTVNILDIGGASTYFDRFLNENKINHRLTILDIVDFEDKPKNATIVIGSAEKIDFPDNSFDLVTGIDMLEHIPNQQTKKKIINEAIRVSENVVIFAGPCQTEAVTRYEQLLNAKNKEFFGLDQEWLAEHFKYGKPTPELLVSCFESAKMSHRNYSILPLSDWYISSLVNLTPAISESVSATAIKDTNRMFNKMITRTNALSENEGYRTFFIAQKGKHNIRKVTGHEYDSVDAIERYVEILAEGIYESKDGDMFQKDLIYYKKENERLMAENKNLYAENQAILSSVEQQRKADEEMISMRVAHKAQAIEARIKKRMH